MANQTTVKDILIDVRNILNGINLPISQVESIGIPVARAISGLNLCIGAFENQEKEQAQKKQHEPEIEVVETGVTDTIPEDGELVSVEGEADA